MLSMSVKSSYFTYFVGEFYFIVGFHICNTNIHVMFIKYPLFDIMQVAEL